MMSLFSYVAVNVLLIIIVVLLIVVSVFLWAMLKSTQTAVV